VAPDVSREELASLVEGSTVELDWDEHRDRHAGDFARWGRRGGLATLTRYGTARFPLLAMRRWERITAETLVETFAAMNGGGHDGRPLPAGKDSGDARGACTACTR
jgi:hypothetical protein